jgi:hypothetical protein
LVRFGGLESALPWRYDSAGYVDRPAQAPDGTIYAVEHIGGARYFPPDNLYASDYGNNKSVVILDGATGQVLKRVPLPTEYSRTPCGLSEFEPRTHGPIVNADGDAYLLVHKDVHVATGTCSAQVTVLDDAGWTLLHLTRNGQVDSLVIDPLDALTPRQFMPDGVGGLLIRGTVWLGGNQSEERLIRFDADSQRTEHVISSSARIDLVGQAGTVYLQTRIGTDDFYGITEALNVTTFTSLWTKSPGWNLTAAKPDGGGTALDGAAQLLDIDSTGQLASTTTFGLARPIHVAGGVIGQGTTTAELKAIAFDSADATRWYATLAFVNSSTYEPSAFGNQFWQLATPLCDPGHPPFMTDWKAMLPGNLIAYGFSNALEWTTSRTAAVNAALKMWTDANTASGLNTRFQNDQAVANPPIHITAVPLVVDENLNPQSALLWPLEVGSNGILTKARMEISLDDFNGGTITDPMFTKLALHETGHALGLDHNLYPLLQHPHKFNGSSVMNFPGSPSDSVGWISSVVTTCDAAQAKAAAQRSWPPQ